MDQRPSGTSEALAFPSEQKPLDDGDPIDQEGEALPAMLQKAASFSNDNVDRALTVAHKLSIQLRAAEDRIAQLQTELESLQSRAIRAERWLQVIKKEIEDRLIGLMEASRPELPILH